MLNSRPKLQADVTLKQAPAQQLTIMVTAKIRSQAASLEEFLANPPENAEWVNGQIVEKNGVTFQHSKIQSRLDRAWGNYMISSGQGGEVCVEVPCRTSKQVRRPDVAYITADLLAQFGEFETHIPHPQLSQGRLWQKKWWIS